jgi:hypothetical protein
MTHLLVFDLHSPRENILPLVIEAVYQLLHAWIVYYGLVDLMRSILLDHLLENMHHLFRFSHLQIKKHFINIPITYRVTLS